MLEQMESALQSGDLIVYLFCFLSGLMASFTPCTYPVLPLTVGYIGNAAAGRRGKAFTLSAILVLGMALVYAVLGLILVSIGSQFGAIWGNGYAVFAIAWFFILMALMLLDVLPFPTPRFLMNLQSQAGKHREGYAGAFLVGGVSGLVVGPCTGPILMVVIAAVTTTINQATGIGYLWSILDGGLKLFLFGLGQGALILLCGVFAGLLSRLPKSGQWMVTIKKAFALLILIGSSLLLVYTGQGTNFPDLTGLLAGVKAEAAAPATGQQPVPAFGGDEFLD
jgi:thiol:disulfide interchange protein DsbD